MSRTTILGFLFALQALCCGFFLFDILWDVFWPANVNHWADSDILEALVTLALFGSLAFTGFELRRVLVRQTAMEDQIRVASGAFGDVMAARFKEWGLTKAEQDVAVLAIKGFSIAEIAEMRTTKEGTIKAQCAALYRKAQVSGRLHLLSLFLEELMDEDLLNSAKKTNG